MAKDKIEIEVIAKGLDAVKADMEALQKSMKKTGQQSQTNASMFKSSWTKAAAAVTVAILGIKKAMDFAKEGAKIQQSMEATAKQFGISVDSMLDKLKQATGETVSNTDLIAAANRTMALNVTTDMDKMGQLFGVARARAKAMGIDTSQAVNDIATGIGRASPLILDNLGIITKGWAEEAKAAGKAFDSQFILNKVLEDGASIVEKSNPKVLTMAERFEKMSATTKNAGDTLKRAFSAELLNAFENFGGKGSEALKKIEKNMVNVRRVMRGILFTLEIIRVAFIMVGRVAQIAWAPIINIIKAVSNNMDLLSSKSLKDVAKGLVKVGKEAGVGMKNQMEDGVEGIVGAAKTLVPSFKNIFADIDNMSVESGNKQVETAKITSEQKIEIKRQEAELEKAIMQATFDTAKALSDAAFQAAQQNREADLANELAAIDAKFAGANQFSEQLKQLDKQDLAAKRQKLSDEVAAAKAAGDTELAAEKQRQLVRMGLEQQEADRELQIKKEKDAEIAAAKKKAWKADKAANIAQSIINTAVAVTKTMATIPFPANIPLAIAQGVAGAAQTAVIASKPMPAFASGTDFAPGGQAIVGERGPELVSLPRGSEVIPNERVTENINNSRVSIQVNTNDPITFVNELRQTYGLDIFQEA